ncbi:transglutaminase domain-containing protein [Tenacibaculum sp. 190524A05c]|uniref:transglutaminase domain-containing protein n=1 Tax=Tenacibaculum platacis TaxID=3137852 RepID=UPI0032B28482
MKKLLLVSFLALTITLVSQENKVKSLVEKSKTLNLEMWELTVFAQKKLTSKTDLAKFFYYWIGNNISYDNEFLREMDKMYGRELYEKYEEKQHAYTVYTDRKGVCAGYANLFKWFMDECDIEVEIVSGHIRDARNHFVELDNDNDFRHAWNAVKLNDKWILVDTTWGTSYDPVQSKFYFDIKPELAINTHYPEDSKWQLLENPLSLKEFNDSKFVQLIWFFSGYSDVPTLKRDKSFYYLVYKQNTTKKDLYTALEISENNKNFKPIPNLIRINQNGYTYLRFKRDSIPNKAYYKVHLYKDGYVYYDNVISFKTY